MKTTIQFFLFVSISVFVFSCDKKTNVSESIPNIETTTDSTNLDNLLTLEIISISKEFRELLDSLLELGKMMSSGD
jgi:hypothetical protein